jgi:phosphoribosylanthranilate isomerase
VCGVTSEEDCKLAVDAGANMIGMILWPKAKRSIETSTAAAICLYAQQHGAQAVGVFVDEDAATMCHKAAESGLDYVQLHGDAARSSLHDISEDLGVIYVMHAAPNGTVQTALPSQIASANGQPRRQVCAPLWLLALSADQLQDHKY